jgi:hypothetical protein
MIGAGVPMPRDDLQALPGSCRPAAVEVEVVDLLPRDREVRAGVDEQDSGCVDDHPARLARSLADLDRAGPHLQPATRREVTRAVRVEMDQYRDPIGMGQVTGGYCHIR